VALEEAVARVEQREPPCVERAGALEQPAAAVAPDDVAEVVPDDGRRGGDEDHELDREVAAGCGDRSRHERGLAGGGHAHRLEAHEQPDGGVAEVGGHVDEREQEGHERRGGAAR
jgi:hypothetical protein